MNKEITPDYEHAFPTERLGNLGMTLRDYFAARAMQGILANPEGSSSITQVAIDSYSIADAMLETRDK